MKGFQKDRPSPHFRGTLICQVWWWYFPSKYLYLCNACLVGICKRKSMTVCHNLKQFSAEWRYFEGRSQTLKVLPCSWKDTILFKKFKDNQMRYYWSLWLKELQNCAGQSFGGFSHFNCVLGHIFHHFLGTPCSCLVCFKTFLKL